MLSIDYKVSINNIILCCVNNKIRADKNGVCCCVCYFILFLLLSFVLFVCSDSSSIVQVSFAFSYILSIFIIEIGFSTVLTEQCDNVLFDRGIIVLICIV